MRGSRFAQPLRQTFERLVQTVLQVRMSGFEHSPPGHHDDVASRPDGGVVATGDVSQDGAQSPLDSVALNRVPDLLRNREPCP